MENWDKTNAELLNRIQQLESENRSLRNFYESCQAEQTKTKGDLNERVKELTALSNIRSEILKNNSKEEFFHKTLQYLRDGSQFPASAYPVIEIEEKRFVLEIDGADSPYGLHANITVNNISIGRLSVYYRQNIPFIIPEEEHLLQGAAESIELFLNHKIFSDEVVRQKNFFEQMFMQSSVSTQILDKDGWCVRINPKLSEIFGVLPEHIEGKKYNILHDAEVKRTGVIKHLESVFFEGKNARWEVFFDIGNAADSQNVEVTEKKKVWYKVSGFPHQNYCR